MNESIVEIAKYTIPSLISLAAAILIVRLFLKKEEDYKKFEITINKAGTVEGTNKMVVNPDGYIHPSPFSEDLERGIIEKIISDNRALRLSSYFFEDFFDIGTRKLGHF
jgi:hypothetical protein